MAKSSNVFIKVLIFSLLSSSHIKSLGQPYMHCMSKPMGKVYYECDWLIRDYNYFACLACFVNA